MECPYCYVMHPFPSYLPNSSGAILKLESCTKEIFLQHIAEETPLFHHIMHFAAMHVERALPNGNTDKVTPSSSLHIDGDIYSMRNVNISFSKCDLGEGCTKKVEGVVLVLNPWGGWLGSAVYILSYNLVTFRTKSQAYKLS